jgi:Golgi phosphoprotein 3 (GPP34)
MTTGVDLVILAVDEKHGTVRQGRQLGFALAAAEVVDLAVSRRIGAAVNQDLKVSESLRTGDPLLDATLAAMAAEPAGHRVSGWARRSARNRVNEYVEAMPASGELLEQATTSDKPSPARYSGLRSADPARRDALIDRLAAIATTADEVSLPGEAFAALAHVAGISDHVLDLRQRQARRRLKDLAGWFADTTRYLPDFQGHTELGVEDLAAGDVNPAAEQPWRLAIRLAVEGAVVGVKESRPSAGSISSLPPWIDEYSAYLSTPS